MRHARPYLNSSERTLAICPLHDKTSLLQLVCRVDKAGREWKALMPVPSLIHIWVLAPRVSTALGMRSLVKKWCWRGVSSGVPDCLICLMACKKVSGSHSSYGAFHTFRTGVTIASAGSKY
eukprot:364447-Chlamydomonas_euryale.AAC.28